MMDITEQRFGKLIAKKFVYKRKNHPYWLCICDCGKEKEISVYNLISNKSKSCGCRTYVFPTKHGFSKTPTYKAWTAMIQRCTNPKNIAYKWYGGRGIMVSNDWLNFENFIKDMGLRPYKKASIERKDFNGNYCKENCIWIQKNDQMRNTSRNKLIFYDGVKMLSCDWAVRFGITQSVFNKRYDRGWEMNRIKNTMVREYV